MSEAKHSHGFTLIEAMVVVVIVGVMVAIGLPLFTHTGRHYIVTVHEPNGDRVYSDVRYFIEDGCLTIIGSDGARYHGCFPFDAVPAGN